MAYITISNSKKIIRKVDENRLDGISEKIYKREIFFFSRIEIGRLKGIRELFRNPQGFALEYYRPIEVVDSFKYLYPEGKPAYHADISCERLHSNFRNIEIPSAIFDRGQAECIKFRNWFNKTTFKENDAIDYITKLQATFPYVGEINPKTLDYSNSGIEEKTNYSLKELEAKIDSILRDASDFFKSNPGKQNLIRRFQKLTFMAYVTGNLYKNDSGLNDEDLKTFLKGYDNQFKIPVNELLIDYYRVQFNPNLSFDGRLLEKLGFKACSKCCADNRENLPGSISTKD
jgi:hypothetical protein